MIAKLENMIGKKFPSDTALKNMKKSELIDYLKVAQSNYTTLQQFYNNAVNVNLDTLAKYQRGLIIEVVDEMTKRWKDHEDNLADSEVDIDDISADVKKMFLDTIK